MLQSNIMNIKEKNLIRVEENVEISAGGSSSATEILHKKGREGIPLKKMTF